MKFLNFKIGVRLGAAFALMLVMMIIVAGIGFTSLRSADSYTQKIVDSSMAKINYSRDMKEKVHIVTRVVRSVALLDSMEIKEREAKEIYMAREKYNQAWRALNQIPTNAKGQAIRDRIEAARATAVPVMDKVIKLALANRGNEAIDLLLNVAAPKVNAWKDAMADNVTYLTKGAQEAAETTHAANDRAKVLLSSITGLALLLGLFASWLITRSITKPLSEAVDAADKVAAGDLTVDIHPEGKDEVANLMRSMNQMIVQLRKTVATVLSNAEAVNVGAGQIASGNSELSTRTQEQAANLEETAASMEQMTSTVKQNADNAAKADQLARSVSSQASDGGEVISRAISAMGEINEASRKITNIIGLIDDIAFQTNLLALNAAVEAARAGEQGRGFAVVASEVRNLAGRSAAAAKDIKELVNDSAAKVEDGSNQVELSGKTLEEIVESIKKVSDIVSEIAAASSEQSSGIDQVNLAVSQMDSMTQQNASLVDESAAASLSMQEQARSLEQQMAFFKLAEGDGRRPRSRAADSADKVSAAELAGQVPANWDEFAKPPVAARPAPQQPVRVAAG